MAQQGERVGPKKGDEPLVIDDEASRALVDYRETVEATSKAVELLSKMDELIDRVNQGLPMGHMVMTRSVSRTPLSMMLPRDKEAIEWSAPKHGSIIYRPDKDGAYRPDGGLVTIGSREVFLGDEIMRTDDNGIVIINTELGVGLTTSSEVTIVDVVDDGTSSEPQRIMHQFAILMSMVDEVRDSKSKVFNTGYL